MPAPQIPVAGVTLDDQLGFGAPKVENDAWTVAPDGINSGKVGYQGAVFFDGATGATVDFPFNQPYEAPQSLNVPFIFGGELSITGASAGLRVEFGQAKVSNAATLVSLSGWDSAAFGRVRAFDSAVNGGGVNFLFVDAYVEQTPLNIPFYFGEGNVVTAVSAGDQLRFGSIADIRLPRVLAPSGVFDDRYGKPRVGGAGGSVNFEFTQEYAGKPSALNVPYYFGGSLPISVPGEQYGQFGLAKVNNSAKTLGPVGFDTLKVPLPRTYFFGQRGADVNFIFVADYTQPSSLNVPFYFAGVSQLFTFGYDQTDYGFAFVAYRIRSVTVSGASYLAIGAPSLKLTADVVSLAGQGIASKVAFGQHTVDTSDVVDLAGRGIASTVAFGQHLVDLATKYVAPDGIYQGAIGQAAAKLTQPIAPYGYDQAEIGEPFVADRLRYLTLFGFRSSSFGAPDIANVVPRSINLANRGIFSRAAFGEPTVYNSDQYIEQINPFDVPTQPGTGALTEYGSPTVKLVVTQRIQLDKDNNGFDASLFGTQFVAHQLRYVDHRAPYTGSKFGVHLIGYAIRYIDVQSILSLQIDKPTVSRGIKLDLTGWSWDSMAFGDAKVELANVYEVQGWDSLTFSTVGNRASYSPQRALIEQGSESFEYGTPTVFNSRQYVTQRFDNDYENEGRRGFGKFSHVFNADRRVDLTGNGWVSSNVYILTLVENAARPLAPDGIAPPTFTGPLIVAYRIRYLQLDGFDSLWVNPYSAVYNAALLIRHTGADYLEVGRPIDVSSNLQTIKHHTPSDLEMGDVMVAFRIRTIVQEPTRDLFAAGLDHRISLWEQYVEPPSLDDGGVGAVDVAGPFRKIIEPRWIWKPQVFGDATVVNFFKDVGPYGFDAFEPDRVRPMDGIRVDFLNRPLTVKEPASVGAQFGRHAIRDRTTIIELVSGIRPPNISTLHRVRREGPEPPVTQYIILDEITNPDGGSASTSEGIKPPINQVPGPQVQGMPYPEGWVSSKYGRPTVRTNVIRVVEWPYPDSMFTFGTPTLNPTQYIKQIEPVTADAAYGVPQLSPYTVWARTDAPRQAKDNHPGQDFTHQYLANLTVPLPLVALANRAVFQRHDLSLAVGGWVGQHSVVLKRRTLSPAGMAPPPLGIPTLPTVIEVMHVGDDMLDTGDGHVVENVLTSWTKYLYPVGLLSQSFGQTNIENFHRPVYPEGFVATLFGNNTPMVYHKPRGPRPTGYVATLWGDAMVDFRIRYLEPESWDSFTATFGLGGFNKRMRVSNRRQVITPLGHDGFDDFGELTVAGGENKIYAYQIEPPRCVAEDTVVTRS